MPCASITCNMFHRLMSTSKSVSPSNKKLMSVTCETSQSGMSEHPTAPHRLIAVSSYQHLGSEEQHFSPDGTASRHTSTAAFSSVPSAIGQTHKAFSVNTRLVHDVTPVSTYPALHVGTQK